MQVESIPGSAFGHWLAGFIAGEGSFNIGRRRGAPDYVYFPIFVMGLRADDRAILVEIQERTGLGKVVGPYEQRRSRPICWWKVLAKPDLVTLVRVCEAYPLRAKKQRDFEIWKQAVHVMTEKVVGGSDVTCRLASRERNARLAALKEELQRGRAYREDYP